MTVPKGKLLLLFAIIAIYIGIGLGVKYMADNGVIEKAPPMLVETHGNDSLPFVPPDGVSASLAAAQQYVRSHLVRGDGHVLLYRPAPNSTFAEDARTNSEAMSYYLLWAAQAQEKQEFDRAVTYVEEKMMHPQLGYLQWRVEQNGSIVEDGGNIASDADLRAIKALLIAERQWGDARYTRLIDRIAQGLETVAITSDGLLAPYGGGSATSAWTAQEVWLSYADFVVFEALAQRRGEPWQRMYDGMKEATLNAQIEKGLYNSMLTEKRQYGNGIDQGGYSINSMWMMIRAAESNDPELRASANRSLAFYKQKFEIDAQLFGTYDSSGNALSPYDSPWVYALVGRAAAALDDRAFAQAMVDKLLEYQITDLGSPLYGAIPEGSQQDLRVGQFTMQESILTLQEYLRPE